MTPRPRGGREPDYYMSRLPEHPLARGTPIRAVDSRRATPETVPPPFPEGEGRSRSRSSKRTPERSSRRRSPSSDSSSSGSLGSEWDDANLDLGGGCPSCRGGGNPPKIPLFHGEPGEWPSYYFAFRQVVNGMRLSNAQRKQRLLQSLWGKAAAYLLAKPHATHFSFRRLLKESWTNLRNAFSAWSSWLSPHCRIEPMPPSQSIALCGAVQRKPPQQSL